jgi:glycosyltransferase involved in cell wall biosynthesis
MPTTSVSVIVPVLNEQDTLGALLDALFQQTRPPDEVVVVDGGSTDDSLRIARHYAVRHPVKVLALDRAFTGKGDNEGVKVAEGGIIAFIDAGIVPEPTWLQKLVEPIEQGRAEVSLGYTVANPSTPIGQAITGLLYGCRRLGRRRFVPSMAIWKTSFFEVGPFREDLRAAMDKEWFGRLDRHTDLRQVRVDAINYYTEFPRTLLEVYHKWAIYNRYEILAGVGWRKLGLIVSVILLMIVLAMAMPASLAVMALAYGARVFITPVAKKCWHFGTYLEKPPLAGMLIIVAVVTDVGRAIGLLQGAAERLFGCGREQ